MHPPAHPLQGPQTAKISKASTQYNKKKKKKKMKFTGANVGRHHRLLSEAVGLPSCVPAIPPSLPTAPRQRSYSALAPRCATIGPTPFTGRSHRTYGNRIRVCPPFCRARLQRILLPLPGEPRGIHRRAQGWVYLGTSRSGAQVSAWRRTRTAGCGRAGQHAGGFLLYTRLAPVMRAGSFIMPARTNQREQGCGRGPAG